MHRYAIALSLASLATAPAYAGCDAACRREAKAIREQTRTIERLSREKMRQQERIERDRETEAWRRHIWNERRR
jgi:hypothetical protein